MRFWTIRLISDKINRMLLNVSDLNLVSDVRIYLTLSNDVFFPFFSHISNVQTLIMFLIGKSAGNINRFVCE